MRRDFVGAGFGGREQGRPAVDRERIAAPQRESGARLVHARERFADLSAMMRLRAAHRQSVEKRHDRRRAPGEPPDRLAAARVHRLRAVDAAPRQMLHQAEEKRQIALVDPLLVQRQQKGAGVGMQEIV